MIIFYYNYLDFFSILELHVLVPQTCKSSSSCCFTKWKYDKIIEKGCNDDTMIGIQF